jgi:hypothetical protein
MRYSLGSRHCRGTEGLEVVGPNAKKLSCSFYLVGWNAYNPLL